MSYAVNQFGAEGDTFQAILETAKKICNAGGGIWDTASGTCYCTPPYVWDKTRGKCYDLTKLIASMADCAKKGGTWNAATQSCMNPQPPLDCAARGGVWDPVAAKCNMPPSALLGPEDGCKVSGGVWSNNVCKCPAGFDFSVALNTCMTKTGGAAPPSGGGGMKAPPPPPAVPSPLPPAPTPPEPTTPPSPSGMMLANLNMNTVYMVAGVGALVVVGAVLYKRSKRGK